VFPIHFTLIDRAIVIIMAIIRRFLLAKSLFNSEYIERHSLKGYEALLSHELIMEAIIDYYSMFKKERLFNMQGINFI
jgi:hypothetical protein